MLALPAPEERLLIGSSNTSKLLFCANAAVVKVWLAFAKASQTILPIRLFRKGVHSPLQSVSYFRLLY